MATPEEKGKVREHVQTVIRGGYRILQKGGLDQRVGGAVRSRYEKRGVGGGGGGGGLSEEGEVP